MIDWFMVFWMLFLVGLYVMVQIFKTDTKSINYIFDLYNKEYDKAAYSNDWRQCNIINSSTLYFAGVIK